jgi:hypothetical protein
MSLFLSLQDLSDDSAAPPLTALLTGNGGRQNVIWPSNQRLPIYPSCETECLQPTELDVVAGVAVEVSIAH